jgi:hypothetical protein
MFLKSTAQIRPATPELVHVIRRRIKIAHPVIALKLAAVFVCCEQRLDTP